MRGEPYQFFLNTPWGENLENQFSKNYTSFSSRFRFNGKEWDEETGNFYYGARYYDPKISVWLSVDRYASFYPGLSPFSFSGNNPLMIVDANGDYLVGANTSSAASMLANIENTFRFKRHEALLSLFKLEEDCLTMAQIDEESFKEAIKDLSKEERALAYGYFLAINDVNHTHIVEVVNRNESLSEEARKAFGGNYTDGESVDKDGGGVNTGFLDGSGTYTVLVRDSQAKMRDWVRVSDGVSYKKPDSQAGVQAHEVIGHGVGRYLGGKSPDAIRVTNLFWHVQGFGNIFYSSGETHGPELRKMSLEEATRIPDFLEF